MNNIQLVIFGASGNLAESKLIPSLYKLTKRGLLPNNFKVIGFSRREWSDDDYSDRMKEGFLKYESKDIDENVWNKLKGNMQFVQGNFNDSDGFENLYKKLLENDKEWGSKSDKVFFLSVMPEFYDSIIDRIESTSLKNIATDRDSKIVVEKPFGHNYESAKALNEKILKVFEEKQIYRIDHVLGKDALQDVFSFREHNNIMRKLLDKDSVDHIQITYLESEGIDGRGDFYENTGVIRDMVQNHLLQMLSITTSAIPKELNSESLSRSREKIITNLSEVRKEDIVIAQYTSGASKEVGYRQEENVSESSNVPTFVALKTYMNTLHWAGVPVYMRTGKALFQKYTEVMIVFKSIEDNGKLLPNILCFRLGPNEGVFFCMKKRGWNSHEKLENVVLDFCYKSNSSNANDAYENLLNSVFHSDHTYFVDIGEVLAAWKFIDPINLIVEGSNALPLRFYEFGSHGPNESWDLIRREGRDWYTENFENVCKLY